MTTTDLAQNARGPYRYLWIALGLLLPAAAFAFAPSYFNGRTFSGLSLTALVHAHAALMVLWLLMLTGQAWLISQRRYALHRWVGRSTFVVVPLILAMTTLVVHEQLTRMPEITTLDARIEIYDLLQVVGFGLAWALALVYRRRTPIHARFMVSTVFAMGNAIVFRILLNWFAWVPGLSVADNPANIDNVAAANGSILLAILFGLIAMDWRLGIRWSPFWLVTVTTLIIHVGFFTFTMSGWWMEFVQWFAGLPL